MMLQGAYLPKTKKWPPNLPLNLPPPPLPISHRREVGVIPAILTTNKFLRTHKYLLIAIIFSTQSFPSYSRTKRKNMAFIKPFEPPQKSVKIKIYFNFYFNTTFRNAQGGKG